MDATPVELHLKTIPSGVPISPEYAEGLAAMDRIRDAVLKNLCESMAVPPDLCGYSPLSAAYPVYALGKDMGAFAEPCPVCHGRRVVPLPELATADRDGVVSVPQVGCERCQPAEPEADKPVEVVG